jgi:hypothetical protein
MMSCNSCYGWIYDTLATPIPNADPKFPYVRASRRKYASIFPLFHRAAIMYCMQDVYSVASIQDEMSRLREEVIYSGIISRKALKYRHMFAMDWVTEKLTCVAGSLRLIHEEHTAGSMKADTDLIRV